jgi:hypothetical protein
MPLKIDWATPMRVKAVTYGLTMVVTVKTGETTTLQIDIDTGIR